MVLESALGIMFGQDVTHSYRVQLEDSELIDRFLNRALFYCTSLVLQQKLLLQKRRLENQGSPPYVSSCFSLLLGVFFFFWLLPHERSTNVQVCRWFAGMWLCKFKHALRKQKLMVVRARVNYVRLLCCCAPCGLILFAR